MSDTHQLVLIIERYSEPTAQYPHGSYLRTVGGQVEVATGHFAVEYPGKPSPYWHDGAPFVVMCVDDWERSR